MGVAGEAVHIHLQNISVIEDKGFLPHPFRIRGMAKLAVCGLLFQFHLLEVAEKTGGLSHGEMKTLNDLGVAGGTSKGLSPADLPEMGSMVKMDPFELNFPFKDPCLMASLPETAGIFHLCPGERSLRPREILDGHG
jgi:hypothetical protein